MVSPEIELNAVTPADKPVLRNLMQLYQYDFSEHSGEDPDIHGLYEYGYIDHYWTEDGRANEGRMAFLIRVNGALAGLVLVNSHAYLEDRTADHNVAEFFVMRKWRRHGVGRYAAHELFRRFPGSWQVGEERANLKAQQFWRAVVGEFTQGSFTEVDSHSAKWDGPVQVFESHG